MSANSTLRQIVLDTETTGISHQTGHRIIEIGCIELIDRVKTGNIFHAYINPKRDIEEGAFRVHGISTEFLQDKPTFDLIVHDLMVFIKDAELIIHNAPFDTGFLNAELSRLKWPNTLASHCFNVIDTLLMARTKHPGQKNTLDALCKRYDVNHFNRELHGALLDAEILAAVYLAMTGGQGTLFGDEEVPAFQDGFSQSSTTNDQSSVVFNVPVLAATEEESNQHRDFIEFLTKKSKVDLWGV